MSGVVRPRVVLPVHTPSLEPCSLYVAFKESCLTALITAYFLVQCDAHQSSIQSTTDGWIEPMRVSPSLNSS